MAADLTHIDTWVFDLDNTLYPPECDLFALIDDRMTRFVMAELSLGWDAARALQKKYYHEHGTTLAGLMAHHGMAPRRFLDEVHDIALDRIGPDPALAAALGLTTILVGPHAQDGAEDFVHHRALALTPFLETARVRA